MDYEVVLKQDNETYLEELAGLISQNRVIPFIGAGMSVPIYPTWYRFFSDVLDTAMIRPSAREEMKRCLAGNEYERAASILETSLGKAGYVGIIKRTFTESRITDDKLDDMAVGILPHIFKKSKVITTNFDRLIEKVFEDAGYKFQGHITPYEVSVVAKGDFSQDMVNYLMKLHGDYMLADRIVFTEGQYDECYGKDLDSQYVSFLTDVLSSRVLLFLGCSLNTDRTMDLLTKIALHNHRTHYAIVENTSDTFDDTFFDKAERLSNIGIKCIWYPKGEHDQVKYFLNEIKKK